MEIFFTIVSFWMLVSLCLFLTAVCKVSNAATPVIAVSFTMLFFVAFGMAGQLYAGGIVYFIFSLCVWLLLAFKKIQFPKLSVYFILFCALSLALILFFGVRQPLLNSWDEFSFWGTAVKLTKINNELHTTAEIAWACVASQKAGLIVLSYFFQFFGTYAQWKIFVALDVLALSVMAALSSVFEKVEIENALQGESPCTQEAVAAQRNKKKRRMQTLCLAMPMVSIFFLTIYVFTINRALLEPSNVYMNAHSDVPMGWLFCAALGLYYVLKEKGEKIWPVNIVLAALIMTRDTALPFALVAWGIMTIDLLFTKGEVTYLCCKNLVAKLLHSFTLLSSVVVSFLSWTFYLSAVTNANPLSDLGGTEEISAVQMVLSGFAQLFGIERTEEFSYVLDLMIDCYFNLSLTMIGSAFVITCLIVFILVVSLFFIADKNHRLRIGIFAVLSTMGFFAYYTFIGFTFVFIFKEDVSTSLIGYERYIYPYLIAWFMLAVYLIAVGATKAKKGWFFMSQGLVFALLLLFGYRCYQYLPVGMTFLDYHGGYLHEREEILTTAQGVVSIVGDEQEGTIYFISQGDNGNLWFQYAGELLPLQMDYSFGGGTLAYPSTSDNMYTYEMTIESFCAYLIENGCGYVFVDCSTDLLVAQFGSLFSDNLQAVADGDAAVYQIEQEADALQFVLIGEVSR